MRPARRMDRRTFLSEGRVHFAGEHTSVHRASMNGALESGVRVAGEVQKAEGA